VFATEQAALRRIRGIEIGEEQISKKLKKLKMLSSYPFYGSINEKSENAVMLSKIGEGIEALSESRQSWWHMRTTNTKVDNATNTLLKYYYKNLFTKKLHFGDEGNQWEIHQDWKATENNYNWCQGLKVKDAQKAEYLKRIATLNMEKVLDNNKQYSNAKLFREAVVGKDANILSLDTDHESDPSNRRVPDGYDDPDTRMSRP
jgi:hypothetical protein